MTSLSNHLIAPILFLFAAACATTEAPEEISSSGIPLESSSADANTSSGSGVDSATSNSNTEGSAGASSTNSMSSSSDGGPTACLNTFECNGDEVCVSPNRPGGGDDTCVRAVDLPYAMRVLSFRPECDGVEKTGSHYVLVGNEATETFSGECPLSWFDDWFILGAGEPVTIEFYEVYPSGDLLVASWCWVNESGCGHVPGEVLHEGTFAVAWDGFIAEFEFVPIEG